MKMMEIHVHKVTKAPLQSKCRDKAREKEKKNRNEKCSDANEMSCILMYTVKV